MSPPMWSGMGSFGEGYYSETSSIAEQRMRRNPYEVIAAAQTGSFWDLRMMGDSDVLIHLPRYLLSDIFDGFCAILKDLKFPSSPDSIDFDFVNMKPSQENNDCEQAFLCLRGMSSFGDRDALPFTDLPAQLIPCWPVLLRWLAFFLDKLKASSLDDDLPIGIRLLCGVIQAVCGAREIAKSLLPENAQIAELVGELWLLEDRSTKLSSIINPTKTMVDCTYINKDTRSLFKSVLLRSDATFVISLAIERLRIETRGRSINCFHVMCAISTLYSMTDEDRHPLQRAFLHQHGLPLLIQTVRRLLTKPLIARDRHGIDQFYLSASVCVGLVNELLCEMTSFRWTAQAIRHGLLELLMDVSSLSLELNDSGLTAADSLLSVIIPRHITFRSVLHETAKSLREIPAEEYRRMTRSSAFRKQWAALENSLTEMFVYKAVLDHEYNNTLLSCHNAECTTVERRVNLKACAACKQVWYCSRACQKASWSKHDHKMSCGKATLVESRREELQVASERDHRFLTRIAQAHVQRHLPALRELHRQDGLYSLVRFEDVRIECNFTGLTPTLEFGVLDSMKLLDQHVTDEDTQKNRAEDATAITITLIYPLEYKNVIVDRVASVQKDVCQEFCGLKRAPCTDPCGTPLECVADEIDEITSQVRELALNDDRKDRYLWDIERIQKVVDEHFSRQVRPLGVP